MPIIDYDIKSQVGATILHRVLTGLFVKRGVQLDGTYQLNLGGNTDFLNMLKRERLESKEFSKTGAVISMFVYTLPETDLNWGQVMMYHASLTVNGAKSEWKGQHLARFHSILKQISKCEIHQILLVW